MKREDLYVRSYMHEDGILTFIESLGGDITYLLQKSGFDTEKVYKNIDFDHWEHVCALFENTVKTLEEPYFGLKWAIKAPSDYRQLGPSVLAVNLVNNLRQALDVFIDYMKIHTNGIFFSYEEDVENDEVIIITHLHPLSPPCRQLMEYILGAQAWIFKKILPNINILRTTFQHSAPKDMSLYDEIFPCPIEFNAPKMTIVLEGVVLRQKKISITMSIVAPLIKKYLNWRFIKNKKAKRLVSSMVAETLPAIFGLGKSDATTVANLMNMHPKKLQRLLKDEGTSYSAILDEVRKSLAARLLEESEISILRIARMLDYSSDRPFSSASKRWFGMSPTKYRENSRKHQAV